VQCYGVGWWWQENETGVILKVGLLIIDLINSTNIISCHHQYHHTTINLI
jgi:hypothetical protein